MIPYGRQSIDEDDIRAVVDVLRSDLITQGPVIVDFETAIKNSCGAKFAVAVNSATSALHIACLALDVGPGDIVWTSSITFVASANCALYCGAGIDFVDIDSETFNISIDALREKLNSAAVKPKVLIVVDMCGQPADMIEISKLASEYEFRVIEDASHAIGSSTNRTKTGSCAYCDIAVFSFHPVKIITSGEGGMALTNDHGLARKMELLRSHAITRDPDEMSSDRAGDRWYYEQVELGFNYRMTDIHAALGLSQLRKLHGFIAKRQRLADRYKELLRDLPIDLPVVKEGVTSSFHLFVIRLRLDEVSRSYEEIFNGLLDSGIGVNLHYIPVYLQPYYQQLGFCKGYCPNAESYYESAISLPIFPDLDSDAQETVANALRREVRK
jgi:UDP-4-amino-4,6-dideoxy-N-acetyl-beta-L-altrosamine transaminase